MDTECNSQPCHWLPARLVMAPRLATSGDVRVIISNLRSWHHVQNHEVQHLTVFHISAVSRGQPLTVISACRDTTCHLFFRRGAIHSSPPTAQLTGHLLRFCCAFCNKPSHQQMVETSAGRTRSMVLPPT